MRYNADFRDLCFRLNLPCLGWNQFYFIYELHKGSNISGGERWGKVYYVPLTYPLYKSTLGNKTNLVLEGAVGENHASKPAFYVVKLRFI